MLAATAWAQSSTTTHKKTTAVKHVAKTSTVKKKPVVATHHPQQPSQDRYKEIQQALVIKGYFKTEPDGTWGPTSVDALKRFQHDQKLVEDGKIGSLSLIALGLGPKREPPVEAEQKTP